MSKYGIEIPEYQQKRWERLQRDGYSTTTEWPDLSGFYWIKYKGFMFLHPAQVIHGSRGTDPDPEPWLEIYDEQWDPHKEPEDFEGFVCKDGKYLRIMPPWDEFGARNE